MSPAPYVLARSCAREAESYFHRANLVDRLRALAEGREFVLARAQLAHAGAVVRISAGYGPDKRFLGYVSRAGVDASDLVDLLWCDLHRPERRAA